MRNLIAVLSIVLLAACAHKDGSPGVTTTGGFIAPLPAVPPAPVVPLCENVSSCGLHCLNTYPDINSFSFQQCMHDFANNTPGYVYTP